MQQIIMWSTVFHKMICACFRAAIFLRRRSCDVVGRSIESVVREGKAGSRNKASVADRLALVDVVAVIEARGFATALTTTTVREQHRRSHHKDATSMQTHPAIRQGSNLQPTASSSMSLPTELDIPSE